MNVAVTLVHEPSLDHTIVHSVEVLVRSVEDLLANVAASGLSEHTQNRTIEQSGDDPVPMVAELLAIVVGVCCCASRCRCPWKPQRS